jgi:plastocyanin
VFAAQTHPDRRLARRHAVILRRAPLFVAVAAVPLLLAGCSGSSSPSGKGPSAPAAEGAQVGTGLLAFDPEEARIKTGETVTWVAGDGIRHVLVEGAYEVGSNGLRTSQTDDKAFQLELTKKGQTVSHTYDKPGRFTYYCTIHQGMNGVVVVS